MIFLEMVALRNLPLLSFVKEKVLPMRLSGSYDGMGLVAD